MGSTVNAVVLYTFGLDRVYAQAQLIDTAMSQTTSVGQRSKRIDVRA